MAKALSGLAVALSFVTNNISRVETTYFHASALYVESIQTHGLFGSMSKLMHPRIFILCLCYDTLIGVSHIVHYIGQV